MPTSSTAAAPAWRHRRAILGIVAVLSLLVIPVVAATPATRARMAVGAVHTYRSFVSPILSRTGVRCRFQPTCSRYAELAIEKYGAGKGSWMAFRRVLRCTPLTPMGTVDLP